MTPQELAAEVDDTPDIAAFRAAVRAYFAEREDALVAKRRSYGASNLTRRGTLGIVIRMEDKLNRLWNMALADEQTTAVGEGRIDAWDDLAGYAVLGRLHEQGVDV